MKRPVIIAIFALVACAHVAPLEPVRGEGAMDLVKLDPDRPSPESVLRQRAQEVDPKDPALPALVARLAATLEKSGGVGIAAPQIGVSRQVFLILHGTRPKGQPTRVATYLNPRVEWKSDEVERDYEACLSIDGLGGLVPRAQRMRFSYDVVGGGPRQTLELAEWDARILQHELDHLGGHVYLDRLEGERLTIDEMRRRRDAGHREKGWIPAETK